MKSIAERVMNLLGASVDLQTVVGNSIAWGLEEEKTKLPFVTFNIVENPGRTKDLPEDFNVRINSYAKSLEEASDIDGLVKAAMYNGKRTKSLGAQSGYTDDDTRRAVIIRTFNFK
jgi:hypothetical protein